MAAVTFHNLFSQRVSTRSTSGVRPFLIRFLMVFCDMLFCSCSFAMLLTFIYYILYSILYYIGIYIYINYIVLYHILFYYVLLYYSSIHLLVYRSTPHGRQHLRRAA